MRPSWCAVFFLLSLITPVIDVFAVNGLTVEGVVRDSTGAALKSADVQLRCGSFVASTKTDESGRFEFRSVPRGKGTLSIGKEGFASVERAME